MTTEHYAKISRSPLSYSATVSSTPPMTGSLTVWALRDFLRAIDASGIPDEAQVSAEKSSVGHLTHLRVHHTFTVDEQTNVDDAQTGAQR